MPTPTSRPHAMTPFDEWKASSIYASVVNPLAVAMLRAAWNGGARTGFVAGVEAANPIRGAKTYGASSSRPPA